ncbi:MAG: caspase family protein [Saprospiraceae bacterium]
MRNRLQISTRLIAVLVLCVFSLSLSSAKNIALIVAIGDYPSDKGWKRLNAINDIELIRSTLMSQGFLENDICVVKNENATHDGILNAIKSCLLQKAATGDMVFFHFSGHGQQVWDNNGDELDGYDEAIVPYDSPIEYSPGVNEGEKLIRDDELGSLFDQVRARIGTSGQLIVVLDSCHSGTGTRGFGVARGTDKIMADSAWINDHLTRSVTAVEKQFDGNQENLAPMVAFFGSSQSELNQEATDAEGKQVGSLSLAVSKCFSKLNSKSTYRSLFENIKQVMAASVPSQTPQAEGLLDMTVLGGKVVEQTPFFTVQYANNSGKVLVGGGWLQGLSQNSVVGFYPPETNDVSQAAPMVKGTVVRSNVLQSTIQLDNTNIPAEELQKAWVFMLQQDPGDLKLNLRVSVSDKNLEASLLKQFEAQPLIRMSEPADLILLQNGNTLELYTPDEQDAGKVVLSGISENTILNKVMGLIVNVGQAKFIRNLEASSSEYQLSLEIIPVDGKDNSKTLDIGSFRDANGTIHFPEGVKFKVKITNNGRLKAYFNLIDIQPNNVVNIIAPPEWRRDMPAEECVLEPGKSMIYPEAYEIGKPYGQEIFKLVATDLPVDLRSIKDTRGNLLRGNTKSTPLEKLFSDTFFTDEVQTRGGRPQRISAGSLGVSTLNFLIEKAE